MARTCSDGGNSNFYKRITFVYSAKRREAEAMKLMNVDM